MNLTLVINTVNVKPYSTVHCTVLLLESSVRELVLLLRGRVAAALDFRRWLRALKCECEQIGDSSKACYEHNWGGLPERVADSCIMLI